MIFPSAVLHILHQANNLTALLGDYTTSCLNKGVNNNLEMGQEQLLSFFLDVSCYAAKVCI